MTEYVMTERQHFNGGFHDAQDDRAAGRTKRDMTTHFNLPYSFGYLAGWVADRTNTSAPAWENHQHAIARSIDVVRDCGASTFGFQITAIDGSCRFMAGGYESAVAAGQHAIRKLRDMVAGYLITL